MKRLLFVILMALTIHVRASSPPPVVEKVDPPNWWIGHTINPVQLLIRGRGFNEAILRSNSPGITVTGSSTSAAGDYIIAYVTIDPKRATPGNSSLSIESAQGSTPIDFTLQSLPDPAGRYQG